MKGPGKDQNRETTYPTGPVLFPLVTFRRRKKWKERKIIFLRHDSAHGLQK